MVIISPITQQHARQQRLRGRVRMEPMGRGQMSFPKAWRLPEGYAHELLNVDMDDVGSASQPRCRDGYGQVRAGQIGMENGALRPAGIGALDIGESSRMLGMDLSSP